MKPKREPDSSWLTERAVVHAVHVACALNVDKPGTWPTNAAALASAAGLDPVDVLSRAVAREAVRQVLESVKRQRKRDDERDALLIEAWHVGMIVREMRRHSWEGDALLEAAEVEVARQLGTLPHVAWSWAWNPKVARRRAASDEGRQKIREYVAEMFGTPAGKRILSFLRRHSEDDATVGRSVDPMDLVVMFCPDEPFLKNMTFDCVGRKARAILARERQLIRRLDALIDGWAAAAKSDT